MEKPFKGYSERHSSTDSSEPYSQQKEDIPNEIKAIEILETIKYESTISKMKDGL